MAIFTTRKRRGMGAMPSPHNPAFLGFPSHLVVRAGDFPVRAFISGALGPVKDQGQQGSCTAHGATSQGERLYRKAGKGSPVFAPAFHYYIEREIEGTLGQGDTGAAVSTSLVVAENPVAGQPGGNGFCPEDQMPYRDNDLTTAPSDAAKAAALQNPGGSWHSVGNNIANIKSCILSDYSGVVGIAVWDSFEDDATDSSGLIPFPNRNVEQLQGYHEMHSLIGFDDAVQCPGTSMPGAVLTQNSWGKSWGAQCPMAALSPDRGFCWLSYAFLMDPNLTTDVRMQHLGKAW